MSDNGNSWPASHGQPPGAPPALAGDNNWEPSGPDARPMQLKVLYTFDNAGSQCLARWPQTLYISAISLNENTTIGIVDLWTCLHAVIQGSPEILNHPENDYTVYAYDYSEPGAPLVGQGLLSRGLETASDPQSLQRVTGRVTQNMMTIFGNGARETLEVKLKLTPMPKVYQRTGSACNADIQSMARAAVPTPPDASSTAEWNTFVQSNPSLGRGAHAPTVSSPALAPAQSSQPYSARRQGSAPPSQFSHQQYQFQQVPLPPPSRPSSISPGTDLNRIPSSPAVGAATSFSEPPSALLEVIQSGKATRSRKQATGRPRGRPPKKRPNPAEPGSTSGADEGTDAEGPQKKRACVTSVKAPVYMSLGSGPDSLRVAASAAGSLRNLRPVLAPNAMAVGGHVQEFPRAPTPVPDAVSQRPIRRIAPMTSLRRESTFEYMSSPDAQPSLNQDAWPSLSDLGAPSPDACTPDSVTSAELRSSPPVPRSRAYIRSSPPSSPVLPSLPTPLPHHVESGFLSGRIDDTYDDIEEFQGELPRPLRDSNESFKKHPLRRSFSQTDEPQPAQQVERCLIGPGQSGPEQRHASHTIQGTPHLSDLPSVSPAFDFSEQPTNRTRTSTPMPSLTPGLRSGPTSADDSVALPTPPASYADQGPKLFGKKEGLFKRRNRSPNAVHEGPPTAPHDDTFDELDTDTFPRRSEMAHSRPATQGSHVSEAAWKDDSNAAPATFSSLRHDFSTFEPYLGHFEGAPAALDENAREVALEFQRPETEPMQEPLQGIATMLPKDMNTEAITERSMVGAAHQTTNQGAIAPADASPGMSVTIQRGDSSTPAESPRESPRIQEPRPASGSSSQDNASASANLPIPASDAAANFALTLPKTVISEMTLTDAPQGENPEAQYSKNLVKKQTIKERLKEAVMKGEMPPFCRNCGAIETPTWRKIWTQEHGGVPDFHELSDKPGRVTTIDVLERDSEGQPSFYRLVKKSLGPEDNKKNWNECVLCNPCGIWLSKFKSQRPPDRWEKDASRLNQPRRKSGKPRDRSKKSRAKTDAATDLTSELNFVTNPPGQLSQDYLLDQGAGDGNPSRHQSVAAEDEGVEHARPRQVSQPDPILQLLNYPKRAGPGSTHSRGSGTMDSPIHLEDDLGATRRLLFPSPRKDGQPKVLGKIAVNANAMNVSMDRGVSKTCSSVGKENKNLGPTHAGTPAPQKVIVADLDQELFGTPPARPSTPPPESNQNLNVSNDGSAFKTPSHRPITRSISRSIRSGRSAVLSPSQGLLHLQRTPSRTPRSNGKNHRNLLHVGVQAHFNLLDDNPESPFTATLQQLINEANEFTADSTSHALLDFDQTNLPNMGSDDLGQLASAGSFDLSTLFPDGGVNSSSLPLFRNRIGDLNMSDVFGFGDEAGLFPMLKEKDTENK